MSAEIETDTQSYTVIFGVSNSGTAQNSTINATCDGNVVSSGSSVPHGKDIVFTASGKGATSYSYAWTLNGASYGNTASITISNISGAVNATCVITGVAESSSSS